VGEEKGASSLTTDRRPGGKEKGRIGRRKNIKNWDNLTSKERVDLTAAQEFEGAGGTGEE